MVDAGSVLCRWSTVGKLVGLVTEGDLIMKDIKLEYPTYIHLLDGFIMYPPSTTASSTSSRRPSPRRSETS